MNRELSQLGRTAMSERLIDNRTLQTVGERFIKEKILQRLNQNKASQDALIGGLGHDSGILRNPLSPNDTLLVNTDRSGVNKAYNLGLAGGECIGDFAVSHAVSDILASGGKPFAISVAMLLPGDTPIYLVDEIVDGIQQACSDYNVTLTGGDTKKSESLSLVVTALGRAPESNLLFRNTPKVGDQLVVTGELGSMLMGSIIYKQSLSVSDSIKRVVDKALIQQRPPYRLGLAVSEAQVAHACTDISDGLQAACRNILSGTNLGIQLNESSIPIHQELRKLAGKLKLTPLQLSMAGGDWQFLYCVPKSKVNSLQQIAETSESLITVIGEVINERGVWANTLNGQREKLRQIEHDSFADRIDGKSYFTFLSSPRNLFEQQS
jgi:thiamine-monophosphate kinase